MVVVVVVVSFGCVDARVRPTTQPKAGQRNRTEERKKGCSKAEFWSEI